jgi:hypothetical protein
VESYKYANRDKKRDGIAQRDKTAMLEVLLPDGGATIIRNGQILEFNLRALVEATACHTERSEERIYESLIQMDDEIATVWDPLIRIDGTSRWSGHVMNSSFTAGSTITAPTCSTSFAATNAG